MGVKLMNRFSEFEANLGLIKGVIPVSLQAQKEDINTTESTMWVNGTQDRYIIKTTSGITTTIESTSANDTAAGTGARTIRVREITDGWIGEDPVNYTMNGTTPVNINAKTIAVNELNVTTTGSLNGVDGKIIVKCDGDILAVIDDSTDHAHNITTQALLTVPLGFTYWVTQFSGESGSGDLVDLRLYANNPVNGVYVLQDTLKLNDSSASHKYDAWIPFPEKHTLEVTAQASLGVNREADCIVHGWLVQNSLMPTNTPYVIGDVG